MAKQLTYKDVIDLWKHYVIDRTGFESDDSGWSPRALIDQFISNRAALLKTHIRNKRVIGEQSVQQLPCIELDEVPIAKCPCAPASGCTWLKSQHPIPEYLKILSVTNIDGKINFNFVQWDRFKYKSVYSRMKGRSDTYYYTIREENGQYFLYIMGPPHLKLASLSGIFEDPYSALVFPRCDKDVKQKELECFPWNTPYLLDRDLVDQVMLNLWNILPQVRNSSGGDILNDTLDNTRGDVNNNI